MGDKYIINENGKCVGRITDSNPDYESEEPPYGAIRIFLAEGLLGGTIVGLIVGWLVSFISGPLVVDIVFVITAIVLYVVAIRRAKRAADEKRYW